MCKLKGQPSGHVMCPYIIYDASVCMQVYVCMPNTKSAFDHNQLLVETPLLLVAIQNMSLEPNVVIRHMFSLDGCSTSNSVERKWNIVITSVGCQSGIVYVHRLLPSPRLLCNTL